MPLPTQERLQLYSTTTGYKWTHLGREKVDNKWYAKQRNRDMKDGDYVLLPLEGPDARDDKTGLSALRGQHMRAYRVWNRSSISLQQSNRKFA
tara:strand:- start:106 stop:384 length:279 start_codon:yes stop_codon:yes gene_type:complete